MSSQKNKASVGRSGSISTRRPPTRRPQPAATVALPEIEIAVDSVETRSNGRSPSREGSETAAITNLNRLKSCSNDEIRSDANESLDEPLDRCSRFRRSLQFAQSKHHAVAVDSGHKAVGELEHVLKKVLGKKLVNGDETPVLPVDEHALIKPASPLKKPTFVTVETLNKTKNNLRRLPHDDDGIEDADEDAAAKPVTGDSRSLDYRGGGGGPTVNRTEEWYNRRKSYGFEKVTTASSDDGGKYAVEPMDSSTDSGICRSTENGLSNSSRQSSVDRESIADMVKKYSSKQEINNNCTVQQPYNTTVVAKGKILEAINSLRSKSSAYFDVVKPSDAATKDSDERNKEQVSLGGSLTLFLGIENSTKKSVPTYVFR